MLSPEAILIRIFSARLRQVAGTRFAVMIEVVASRKSIYQVDGRVSITSSKEWVKFKKSGSKLELYNKAGKPCRVFCMSHKPGNPLAFNRLQMKRLVEA